MNLFEIFNRDKKIKANASEIDHLEEKWILARRSGFNLLLEKNATVDEALLSQGTWEYRQLEEIKKLTQKCAATFKGKKVFIDIGSYWGWYALNMERMGVFDSIIAIEADVHNYSQLQAQLFMNRLAYKIRTHNIALADKEGVETMLCSTGHPYLNRAGAGIFTSDEHLEKFFSDHGIKNVTRENAPVVSVKTIALDSLYDFQESLIVVKMDIEGFEWSALNGMRKTINNNWVILQLEILPGQSYSQIEIEEEFSLEFIKRIENDYFFMKTNNF